MKWGILRKRELRWKRDSYVDTVNRNYTRKDDTQTVLGVTVTVAVKQHVNGFLQLVSSKDSIRHQYVQIYLLTGDSIEEDLESFYSIIDKTEKHIKLTHIQIFIGDWNTKVKKVESVLSPYGLGSRNERRTRFVEF